MGNYIKKVDKERDKYGLCVMNVIGEKEEDFKSVKCIFKIENFKVQKEIKYKDYKKYLLKIKYGE